ncbi:MAG: TIGR00296 family protein [Nitrososphaerota archaeon]|nr:TIGR00296 family protein [Aigarchaeota archaeon]MDW8076036.1 TIGR00296 family protein [Nitrososphaerota archaeon]
MLGLDEGIKIVKLARVAIQEYLKSGKIYAVAEGSGIPTKESGVFVSLYTYPEGELRGCIGFPLPIMSLPEAVVRAAIAAATEDPRFSPVELNEMNKIVVEVSVLSVPEKIEFANPRELPSKIVVGRDGLMIKSSRGSGLLLPQVPVEYGWDSEEFLCHLCMKAGLPATYWLTGKFDIYRFTADIFAEESPGGNVVRKELKGCEI